MSNIHYKNNIGPKRKEPICFTDKGVLPFRLEVLTPVYVGSGEKLSPLESVLHKDAEGHAWLHRVDLDAYIADHADPEALLKEWEGGTLPRIWRSVQKMDVSRYTVAKSRVMSAQVVRTIEETLQRGGETRKTLEIDAAIRNPLTHALYIPGSSIKGSIRTVILDALDTICHQTLGRSMKTAVAKARGNVFNANRAFADAAKDLLGDIGFNAMQELKVSDVAFAPEASLIVASKNCSIKPDKAGTPTPACESIAARSLGNCSAGYGRLMLASNAKGEPCIFIPTCNATWFFAQLVEKCNAFYYKRFEAEWQKFYSLSHFAEAQKKLTPIREYLHSLDVANNCSVLLLRVGHYSHIECVTVTNNAPSGLKGAGNTRTLANGELPFGWVLLHLCDNDEYTQCTQHLQQILTKNLQEKKEHRRHLLKQAALARDAQEQKEALLIQQKIYEETEAARLAALSPVEKMIELLQAGNALEKDGMEAFTMLKTIEGSEKICLAQALKTFWQISGKWNEKKCSEKQAIKIAALKTILSATA